MAKKADASGMYRIRSTLTGLYSEKGSVHDVTWTQQGHIWQGLNALKRHLRQMPFIPEHWEIVRVEVVDREVVQVKLDQRLPSDQQLEARVQAASTPATVWSKHPNSWRSKSRRYLREFYPHLHAKVATDE